MYPAVNEIGIAARLPDVMGRSGAWPERGVGYIMARVPARKFLQQFRRPVSLLDQPNQIVGNDLDAFIACCACVIRHGLAHPPVPPRRAISSQNTKPAAFLPSITVYSR